MVTYKLYIPVRAQAILDALQEAGHEAFMVGGAVRDLLLGRPVDDIDIASDADAVEAMGILSEAGARVIPTGIAHGTITAILSDETFEVTTYRIDGGYSDSRHPDSITRAKSIEEDLARRDFTINAMAYNRERGLVDPHGGQDDLESRIVRCVGDPSTRFNEDALRILRALRFSAQLGFTIDIETEHAALACAPLLENISRERICIEFTKMLCAPDGADVLRRFESIISVFMPELLAPDELSSWRGGLSALRELDEVALPLRLAALLGNMRSCERILARLRYPKDVIRECLAISRAAYCELPSSTYDARRLLCDMGADIALYSYKLRFARSGNDEVARIAINRSFKLVEKEIHDDSCFSLRQLAVSGEDIKRAWDIEGVRVGQVLDTLLECVMRDEIPNTREDLLAARPPSWN